MPNGPIRVTQSIMTAITSQTGHDIRRCAFCKIDRKGRFILADPMTQELLGLSEVELFGRPLIDFLDPADHLALEQMTSNRNPYETVYDASHVTLVGKGGNRTPATLIVSVNFGGGNPANYQVLINPDVPVVDDTRDQAWSQYLDHLMVPEGIEDTELLAQLMRRLTRAAAVAIYEVGADGHSLLAVAESELFQANSGGATGRIEVDPGDNCPANEIRATFGLADDRLGLVVMTLDLSAPEQAVLRHSAEMAAVILHTLCPPVPENNDKPTLPGPFLSVVRVLNQMEIGAVVVGSRGEVLEQNSAIDRLLDISENIGSIQDLIDLISRGGSPETAAAIRSYFDTSSECEKPPSLRLSFKLGSTGPITISFERLKPGTEDISGCFMFSRANSHIGLDQHIPGLSYDLSVAAIELLRSSITAALTVWRKLEHEHHGELGRDGGFYLKCLSYHLANVDGMLSDLDQTLRLIQADELPQTVDPGLVIDKIVEEFASGSPGGSISVKHTDLPKIKTYPGKLTAVLRDIFAVGLDRAGENQLEFRVTASRTGEVSTIWIRDNGPDLSRKQTKEIFALTSCRSRARAGGGPNRRAGLALATALLESMGGWIELEPTRDRGTTVKILIPDIELCRTD